MHLKGTLVAVLLLMCTVGDCRSTSSGESSSVSSASSASSASSERSSPDEPSDGEQTLNTDWESLWPEADTSSEESNDPDLVACDVDTPCNTTHRCRDLEVLDRTIGFCLKKNCNENEDCANGTVCHDGGCHYQNCTDDEPCTLLTRGGGFVCYDRSSQGEEEPGNCGPKHLPPRNDDDDVIIIGSPGNPDDVLARIEESGAPGNNTEK